MCVVVEIYIYRYTYYIYINDIHCILLHHVRSCYIEIYHTSILATLSFDDNSYIYISSTMNDIIVFHSDHGDHFMNCFPYFQWPC